MFRLVFKKLIIVSLVLIALNIQAICTEDRSNSQSILLINNINYPELSKLSSEQRTIRFLSSYVRETAPLIGQIKDEEEKKLVISRFQNVLLELFLLQKDPTLHLSTEQLEELNEAITEARTYIY